MANHKSKNIEGDDAEEEVVRELPFAFVKELTAKQNKRTYIVEEYNATKRDAPVEGKFYTQISAEKARVLAERQKHWHNSLANRDESRRMHEFPVLESQMYGWMPSGVSRKALKRVNYIQAPKQRCEMTAYDEYLISERVTQRPKFTGLRFNLN